MKIEINIDEAQIQELADKTPINELPQQIYWTAKHEAVAQAVTEIKNKLVEKPYFSDSERLYGEVSKELYKRIEGSIKKFTDAQFNDEKIMAIITRQAERIITEWLEKKIYERLEQAKKDIYIGSYGELEEMERVHQDEIQSILENQ